MMRGFDMLAAGRCPHDCMSLAFVDARAMCASFEVVFDSTDFPPHRCAACINADPIEHERQLTGENHD